MIFQYAFKKCCIIFPISFSGLLFIMLLTQDLRLRIYCMSSTRRRSHTVSASCASLSVLRSGNPPVYHDWFTVKECKKSANRQDMENKKRPETSTVTAPTVPARHPVKPEQQQTGGQQCLLQQMKETKTEKQPSNAVKLLTVSSSRWSEWLLPDLHSRTSLLLL